MFEAMIIAGLGGFAGSCCRYLIGVAAKKIFGTGYPAGTFIVNIAGCFIIGIFFGVLGRHQMSPVIYALLITGFSGGFTTFSSFSLDMYSLLQRREWLKFILYLVTSIALGIIAVWLGMKCV